MLKRNGERKERVQLSPTGKTAVEKLAAFSEAFGAVQSEYQTLCVISNKVREVERVSHNFEAFQSQVSAQTTLPNPDEESPGPWEICTSLMKLDNNEVLLCKRAAEHGAEYAVIDRLPAAAAYAKANGPRDIMQTGDDPRWVLREYLRSERLTLELMASDITATVREFVAERFPRRDSSRVINEIAQMCKNVLHIEFAESLSEVPSRPQKNSHGVQA